jgi:hypothetical protein
MTVSPASGASGVRRAERTLKFGKTHVVLTTAGPTVTPLLSDSTTDVVNTVPLATFEMSDSVHVSRKVTASPAVVIPSGTFMIAPKSAKRLRATRDGVGITSAPPLGSCNDDPN